MNAFFLSKVDSIRNKIADVQNTLRGPQSIMSGKSCKLVFSGVSVSKVNRLIRTLKNSKSTSIDQIDNYSLRIAANIIDAPLQHIINMSIEQQTFPNAWKCSKVIPLHKKGCKLDKKNYRPVSLLSPLSKIVEIANS